MKETVDRVPAEQQHTGAVEGYIFIGRGNAQMAFWTCSEARSSDWHTNSFDEYLLVVSGEYVLLLDDSEQVLAAGSEVVIPGGVRQAARIAARTRTIHAFGGPRVTVMG